jgi:hypothetical protein
MELRRMEWWGVEERQWVEIQREMEVCATWKQGMMGKDSWGGRTLISRVERIWDLGIGQLWRVRNPSRILRKILIEDCGNGKGSVQTRGW